MTKDIVGNNSRVYINEGNLKGKLLHRTRKKEDIIFGARSIQKQIGILARPTRDFDIFTKKPKASAVQVEKKFDRVTRGDNFYTKKGKNPGTWKVKWKGKDNIKGTDDDKSIVDYTIIPKKEPKFVKIDGIRYRTLSEELKAKIRITKNKEFAFRKPKDSEDVRRILRAGRSRRRA